jgi:hypothetical protein
MTLRRKITSNSPAPLRSPLRLSLGEAHPFAQRRGDAQLPGDMAPVPRRQKRFR